MIFALRARPPCTKMAALFAGTKGVLVLIYAKNVQLLVYHTTFLPFVNGKVEEFVPFPGVEDCAPIFFGSCPKKMAAPGAHEISKCPDGHAIPWRNRGLLPRIWGV